MDIYGLSLRTRRVAFIAEGHMGKARTGCTLLASTWLIACAVDSGHYADDQEPQLGVTQQPLISPCNETVPENRFIDGIPAYAQCEASMNSAIWSNNGVDTSLTQMGPDWVRTQFSGGFQCTELANRYLRFKWNVTWIPRGNAGQWCDTVPPANSGLVQTTTPVHGDLMVLAGGSCGAAASTGHVVVVDRVEANGRLSVVEQNRANRGSYMPSCGKCFLHVVANDGSGTGGAGIGAAGGGMPAGGGPAPAGAGGAGGSGGSGPPSMNGSAGMAPPMEPATPNPNPQQPTPQMPVNPMPAQPASNAGAGSPVTAGMPAPTAGTTGGVQVPPSVPIPLNTSSADDTGCSVARVGSDHLGDVRSPLAWLALAFTALFVRATRRRRA